MEDTSDRPHHRSNGRKAGQPRSQQPMGPAKFWRISRNLREGRCIVFEVVTVLPTEAISSWRIIDTLNALDEIYETALVRQLLLQFTHEGMLNLLFSRRKRLMK